MQLGIGDGKRKDMMMYILHPFEILGFVFLLFNLIIGFSELNPVRVWMTGGKIFSQCSVKTKWALCLTVNRVHIIWKYVDPVRYLFVPSTHRHLMNYMKL